MRERKVRRTMTSGGLASLDGLADVEERENRKKRKRAR
jgi:hypothetical protein